MIIFSLDGTAREAIKEYEAMESGDNDEQGPQRCKNYSLEED